MEGSLPVGSRFVEYQQGFVFGGGGKGEVTEVGLFGAFELLGKEFLFGCVAELFFLIIFEELAEDGGFDPVLVEDFAEFDRTFASLGAVGFIDDDGKAFVFGIDGGGFAFFL